MQVPESMDYSATATSPPTRSRLRPRPKDGQDAAAENDTADSEGDPQPGYGTYVADAFDEEEYIQGVPAACDTIEDADLQEADAVLEAVCLQRALFTTPDGRQGIFVALPTAEDQPVPFLFVQVVGRCTAELRTGGGCARR